MVCYPLLFYRREMKNIGTGRTPFSNLIEVGIQAHGVYRKEECYLIW